MKKIIFIVSILLIISSGYSKEYNTGFTTVTSPRLGKVLTDNPERTIVNIGNWGYWLRDNGESAMTPAGDSGGIYPRGTAAAIYLDGTLVGGYQNGHLKVSGQIYTIGTERGYILNGEHITQSKDPRVRIYRMRKDWETLTANQVRQGAAELNETTPGKVTDGQIQKILDQYKKDWEEWPTEIGAPYYDLNNNGVYEPELGETPGIANADQVVWFVITDANPSTTLSLYGTAPIGIEIQMTLWAYNQPGAGLGQIVFKQIRIINKGDGDLVDAYISLWSDPDVGNYSDDLVGVDVDKSLMYVYNGAVADDQYTPFGLAPPAAGYDFFAGPIVESPGDVAIFDLKERAGYKNLPASSFGYFSAGGVYSDPGPYGEVEGAREYYNLMRGFAPIDDLENPTPWLDHNNNPTVFPYSGDPVAGTGHLDSSPADRRMLINSGPFVLAEGDTQDIVVAVVGGLGDNNLSSITAMKNTDLIAQKLFDDLFKSVPSAPAAPIVNTVALDNSVILDWGSSISAVSATENVAVAGYEFQGYNIYQLPSPIATKGQATRIGTFDLIDGVGTVYGNIFVPAYGETVNIPVQFGLDNGIARTFEIDHDYLTGGPLYSGSVYYFAVTAYNYNAAPTLIEDQALESALTPILVTLTPPPLNTEYGAVYGDAIETAHPEGPSDGSLVATVVDPTQLTGDDYEAFFAVEEYFLDFDGIWKNTTESAKANAKLLDVSPSVVTGVAVTGPGGTLDLNFEVDVQSPDYNYAAGVLITVPGAVINSATAPDGIAVAIQADGLSVLFGDLDIDGAGDFAGGEHITINVLTSSVDNESIAFYFVIYDDGWGDLVCDVDRDGVTDPDMVDYCNAYGLGPGNAVIANAEGSGTITEFGYAYKTIEGWYVRNLNTNQIVTPHSTLQGNFATDNIFNGIFVPAHEAGANSAPVAEGIQVQVFGPDIGIKAVSETDADDVVLDANVGVYPPSLGTTGYILSHRDHAGLGAGRTHDRFDFWNMDDVIIDFSETSLCFSYSGATTITETVSGDQSMAPFSVYRKKFPSGEMMRLFTGWWDTDDDGIWGATDPYWTDYGKPSYEAIYAWQGYDAAGNEIPYDPANHASYIAEGGLPNDTGQSFGSNPGFYNYPFVTATMMVLYLDGSTPPWGNKIWLTTNKANTAADKFTFTAPANIVSETLAKEAVKKINVFPNPYYANNSQELNRFDNFVTFTHLPQKAKIKIFSLDGKIVRELDKNIDSQYLQWDLRNHTNLPVASGVYFAHIDMDIDDQNLGSKVLKLFIIQANQVVKYY